MRIYFVLDETRFYHPNFVARFLEKTTDEVVGAALVTKISSKNSIEHYLKENWFYLKFSEIAKLFLSKYMMAVKDKLCKKQRKGNFYSIQSVFNFFKIDFMKVEYNINKKEYVDQIREKAPDVIISSNSLIFNEEILNIPKICCINRHCALLPAYGGLWPVFQAYRNGESYTGASVHTMERSIDKGIVLTQKKIPIKREVTLANLYTQCFEISTEVVLKALDKIRKKDFSPYPERQTPSYFSFPTKEQWKDFRKRNGRFI